MCAPKGNRFARKYTDEDIDRLGNELIEFAEKDKSIHWARFCRRHMKSRQWLLDLSKYYPKFEEYYQIARELMSAKISDLCLYDKESGVNANFGKDNLFRYDDEWVEHLEWKEKIKQKNLTEEEANIIVQAINYAKKS